MNDLDNLAAMRSLDKAQMLERTNEVPEQLLAAWGGQNQLALPARYGEAANVVVVGMGGSAIGGSLVASLVADEMSVPMHICREYSVPAYVGPRSLVIASSFSGETEETLAAFQESRDRGAMLVAVTRGGRLRQLAEEAGAPVFSFAYESQPRAAIGYGVGPVLAVLVKTGLVGDKASQVVEAVDLLRTMREEMAPAVPSSVNLAKKLARAIHGHVPFVYGYGLLGEVARRWKGQFNENSKSLAAYDLLPELNHNAVVGYEFPPGLAAVPIVVLLRCLGGHPRLNLRVKVTEEILQSRGIQWYEVQARGESGLAQMMSALYVGDFVSYYLAMLYGVDPSPVETITYLKRRLADGS